jgi:hypothetical protein
MNSAEQKAFLDKLLLIRTSSGMRSLLQEYGDSDSATIDAPNKYGLVWKPFGGTASNFSTIGLGTKPGRSLTERITNAIDALLEDRAPLGVAAPNSPRLAASQWFGRPVSTSESGLFSWKDMPDDFSHRIHVVLQASEKETAPTIDVTDDGIGIAGKAFPSTILSLQGQNKIKKRHLIGAFGQGGAATLAFCDYAIIASRPKDNPSRVAFTVIRVLKLDATYKEDCYAYLAVASGSEAAEVFECEVGTTPLTLYQGLPDAKVRPFEKGTLVRHVCYRLTNLDKGLQASPGNLYHYLHYTIFDPLIPFRVVDLRSSPPKNEYIGGARNRLMTRLKQAKSTGKEEDDGNIQIKHYRPMEFVAPVDSTEPVIGVEYWVVFGFRKKGEGYELRSHSNELFVQPGHPIVGTLNGQNQGEHTASVLKQIGLSLLSRHMVVHVDCTGADSTIRRELFSTSREGFKDGPVLDSLLSILKKMLHEDETLAQIEKELTESIAKKDAESTKSEVKKEVTRLLKDAGFSVGEVGKVDVPGPGPKVPVNKPPMPGPVVPDPLATLPYPEVTKFAIVYPKDIFQLPLNETQSILVETNADAAYDKFVKIRSEPPLLEVATRAPLRGGRVRWRLRPIQTATAGAEGEVIVSLTRPDGSQLESKVLYGLIPAKEKEAKKSQGQVPPFDIKPVSPENGERWNSLWPDDKDDPDVQRKHAYKVLNAGGVVTVYYSTVFTPLVETIEKLKATHPVRLGLFDTNYQIWIGYHAILQSQQNIAVPSEVGEEVVEELQEAERQTVARVQIRQALRAAELLEQKAVFAEMK